MTPSRADSEAGPRRSGPSSIRGNLRAIRIGVCKCPRVGRYDGGRSSRWCESGRWIDAGRQATGSEVSARQQGRDVSDLFEAQGRRRGAAPRGRVIPLGLFCCAVGGEACYVCSLGGRQFRSLPPIRWGRPSSSSICSVNSRDSSVRKRLGFIMTRLPPRLR